MIRAWLLCAISLLGGCLGPSPKLIPEVPNTPFVLVLGTAQDGGLPQVACVCERCARARRDPGFQRLVASLLIVDPRNGARWLVDATPDFPQQVQRAQAVAPRPPALGRPALFDGIFLTHAHFGHYTGLAYLGREVYGAKDNAVWGSARMGAYLASNGPWSQLVETGNVNLHLLVPGESVRLSADLSITPFSVPHRDEFTDTLGFLVRGPNKSLVYIPDIDKWSVFGAGAGGHGSAIEALIQSSDVALLDGSFFADGEIPGRAMQEIPHPFIRESLLRFAELPREQRSKVHFTHLNHTNPAVDPAGTASAEVRAAGMRIAAEGQVFGL